MTRKVSRWVRSKSGMRVIAGVVVAALVVVVAGALLGWWTGLADLIRGTAVVPVAPACEDWAPPEGGYTYLPTASETDGKMIVLSGAGLFSFTDEPMTLWIAVPRSYSSFELGIFDGDSCKDNAGNVRCSAGNWDQGLQSQTIYTLYADRLRDGMGTQVVQTWSANSMPNNAWYDMTFENVPAAQSPCGHYFYRLEARFEAPTSGEDNFKLRSTGYLIAGGDAVVGLNGALANFNDVPIIYPDYAGPPSYALGSATTYDGDWRFKFYIPTQTSVLEIWDGDFDRGTSSTEAADTDDPETAPGDLPPGIVSSAAKPEGVQNSGKGIPPDNNPYPVYRRGDPVWYEIIDPDGQPIYTNSEPSGTEEWERYVISTNPGVAADEQVGEIKAGWYTFHIVDLDVHNFVWLKTPYLVDEIPPPPCDATCPRTIGYWKNNVKKVLIDNKTGGVQETRQSIELALDTIAEYSPLFRSGINVNAPVAIGTVARLTDQEANAILQKENGNSMLDRALQQNLATWLNWASGKICKDNYIVVNTVTGTFEGTVWEALQEAQNIILNQQGDETALERAKDIADRINNGDCGEECSEDLTCEEYAVSFPPADQPPPYNDLPEAPDAAPPVPPAPPVCTVPIHNQYGVESPATNPFYGIKFEYQSGEEVVGGAHDVFKYTLPADAVAAMTSVQLEAKAGQYVGQTTLEGCDFASAEACGTVAQGLDGSFIFQFMGATDNGDGTLTLTFHVINFTDKGLSHATFGLPDGVVPSSPSGSYQSEVCP